ncbi:outer membrane protein, OMP85 family [Neisseria flavescens NRL30031/H210]|uniref:Outer membrane protein, OMP85 family n=2 Tax=Neisseria flavescens TaxID=484 RepID=C0EQ05_NEIFL|nr:outer membrane protein, OMP85 family [Neisseria flavescens NRL30031/H210]
MLTASWKRQSIETELHPQNGYYLDGKIGATLGKFLSSTQMARATARAGYFFTPENKKLGTFIVRGQAGYVYAREGEEVPSGLMFRTGGATSVRGYELDSIGLAGPNGSILPQRALVVGSLEYQFPVTKSFSGAIFHDVGDAASNFKHMTLKHGTGLGVRWFSPVAPFSFDIAYGHHDKKIRWHISLGTRF